MEEQGPYGETVEAATRWLANLEISSTGLNKGGGGSIKLKTSGIWSELKGVKGE